MGDAAQTAASAGVRRKSIRWWRCGASESRWCSHLASNAARAGLHL